MRRYNENRINARIQREQKNEYARERIQNDLKLDTYSKIQGISIDKADAAQTKKQQEESFKRENAIEESQLDKKGNNSNGGDEQQYFTSLQFDSEN